MALSALRDYIARDFLAAYTAVNPEELLGLRPACFLAAYTAVNHSNPSSPTHPNFLAAYTAVNNPDNRAVR